MAGMVEKKSPLVNGGQRRKGVTRQPVRIEVVRAQDVARRYRCEYVDLREFQLHHDLFRRSPST